MPLCNISQFLKFQRGTQEWPCSLGNTALKSTIFKNLNNHGLFDVAYVLNGGTDTKKYICIEAGYCALNYKI